jgi:hypothetical protein
MDPYASVIESWKLERQAEAYAGTAEKEGFPAVHSLEVQPTSEIRGIRSTTLQSFVNVPGTDKKPSSIICDLTVEMLFKYLLLSLVYNHVCSSHIHLFSSEPQFSTAPSPPPAAALLI